MAGLMGGFYRLPPSGVSRFSISLKTFPLRLSLLMHSARPQVKPLTTQIPPTIFFVRDSTKK